MKKVYLLLSLFGIWCLACALWFMFDVRGINAANTNPQHAALAMAEILVMTLFSVLIGFGIAWYLREEHLAFRSKQLNTLATERKTIIIELNSQKEQTQKAEHTLARARETFREDFFTVSRDKERFHVELENSKQEISRLQAELGGAQSSVQNLQRHHVQLQQSVIELEQSNRTLQASLAAVHQQSEKNTQSQVDFISERILAASKIEKEDIDDLKVIKGIGAVIEKKLNMLGIVNFKQISELSDAAIEQIAHTVKFFPERIKRDQWVRQAVTLYQNKVNRV